MGSPNAWLNVPLNTDIREIALKEIKRLQDENAALKEELANRPGGGHPSHPDRPHGPPTMPPALPQQAYEDQIAAEEPKE